MPALDGSRGEQLRDVPGQHLACYGTANRQLVFLLVEQCQLFAETFQQLFYFFLFGRALAILIALRQRRRLG